MKCTICGAEIADNATFCDKCGAIIDNSAKEQEAVTEETVAVEEVKNPGKVMGIISLVLGILSLAMNLCCVSGLGFSVISGIAGIILGFVSAKKSDKAGMEPVKLAKIGKLLSIIGTILGALIVVVAIIVGIVAIASNV